jgi:cellulose synthase/poly-beta-1,6-N-acetylglucosamine synthase-like glycosyltransferase
MREALYYLNIAFLVYFVLVNGFYLVLIALSSRTVERYGRITEATEYEGVFETTFYKPVSVIIPAHNEAATIVHTVASALAVQYPELEVVVVNDGSTDETLHELIRAFDLVPSPDAVISDIPCQRICGLYESVTHPGLRVVDKEQGGKADALNAGINASTFPLVCNIDADSIIDVRSMVQITRPFLEDHRVMAVGGVVMPANGCDIENGEIKRVRLARNWWARFQTVEYLRAFLFGRIGWTRLNSLMIISGAFAIFRRTALIDVQGYRTDTVGEDMELVLRMHRFFTDQKRPYRVIFLPDPICWTQAPEDLKSLSKPSTGE